MASKKTCFIISPIGDENSTIREDADAVFEYIIKPATERCGIDAQRSDHIKNSGEISTQMYSAILSSDLCIAVLFGKNPNVMYELAIAQCANRPLIIMILKGEILPFDIKDLRCVYYDLRPKPLHDETYVNEIIAHIHNLEAMNWKVKCPIPGLKIKSSEADFYSESQERHFELESYLTDAQERFDIMGLSLKGWKSIKNFSEKILEKAQNGCLVRVLIIHPGNVGLGFLINEEISEISKLEQVKQEIKVNYQYYTDLSSKDSNIQVRQIQAGLPMHIQTINDNQAVMIPYFYSQRTIHSPLLKCQRGSHLYTILNEEFESLWNKNAEIID